MESKGRLKENCPELSSTELVSLPQRPEDSVGARVEADALSVPPTEHEPPIDEG